MFRGTGVAGIVLAAIFGIIVADVLTHPAGTRAAGGSIVALEKNTGNQLLGR